jgi:sugar phosphate permease
MLRWRIIIFAATWLTYFGFYFTRSNFTIAQPDFMKEFAWTKEMVGIIASTYLTVYAIGQLVNGRLVDRIGPRWMIAVGFALTAAMSASLGFSSTILAMTIWYGINGYAQSIGWSACTKAMTSWTPIEQRGRVMGIWGTNYPAGHAASNAFAAAILGAFGWRETFWIPAISAIALGAVIVAALRDHPRDVFGGQPEEKVELPPPKPKRPLRAVLTLKVFTLGIAYFCIKFVRYTFIFWFGLYLKERFQLSSPNAGYFQVPFPLAGVLGSVAGGAVSDRLFGARRAPVATLMLIGLTLSLLALLMIEGSIWAVAMMYAACGFFLFGPDMLISGTSAMDFGDEDAAGTVTGIVNGMGSIGGAIQGVVVGVLSERAGWPAVFALLVGMGVVASAVTATLWNARGRA